MLGSGVTALACAQGSASATVAKSGTYPGLAVGDRVDFTYRECTTPQGVTLNGSFSVLPLQVIDSTAGSANSSVPLSARIEAPSSYRYSMGNGNTVVGGTADMQMKVVSGGQYTLLNVTVPEQSRLVTTLPSVQLGMSAGTSFSQEWSLVQPVSFRFKGEVSVSAMGLRKIVRVETLVPLTGGRTSETNPYQPRSGTVATQADDPRLSTRVTFSGSQVHIEGDTDLNGTPDLVLDVPFATLLES
jgi:hypothetical protein